MTTYSVAADFVNLARGEGGGLPENTVYLVTSPGGGTEEFVNAVGSPQNVIMSQVCQSIREGREGQGW